MEEMRPRNNAVAEKLADAVVGNPPLPPLPATLTSPRGWVDPRWQETQREHAPKRCAYK